MFLKSLRIANHNGVIRDIRFRAGMNLIVDDTPLIDGKVTGNNVGKTTVLMLIDFCFGANARDFYIDPEGRKAENKLVKEFLIQTEVVVVLTLGSVLDEKADDDLVIERSFKLRAPRMINGRKFTELEAEAFLRRHLFTDRSSNKPSFRQIISHNIRYREPGLSHTLRNLHPITTDTEYEALYLFLLNCPVDQADEKQRLLKQLAEDQKFKKRLEDRETQAGYMAALGIVQDDIAKLTARRNDFKLNTQLDEDLSLLAETKYKISHLGSDLIRVKLRRDLAQEAVRDESLSKAEVDLEELRALYDEVGENLGELSRSFAELLDFHNQMVAERTRYVAQEVPALEQRIQDIDGVLKTLVAQEAKIVKRLRESGSMEDLEKLINESNEHHRRRGELEATINAISDVEIKIEGVEKRLREIEGEMFSKTFGTRVQQQIDKLNLRFSAISDELYGERYAVKADHGQTSTGQPVYKFTTFNANNFSPGKKQGEISCFDIAYTLFADSEGIPCFHFLLNDRKELMHDNQLVKIAELVERERESVQFVVAILRDKLPAQLDDEKYIVIRLSQVDKLFRIENQSRAPVVKG